MNKTLLRISSVIAAFALAILSGASVFADTYTDITPAVSGMDVRSIGTNGSTWMIGGVLSNQAALFSYNGASPATDLSGNPALANTDVISAIGWNGSYWMVGGSGETPLGLNRRLFRYDGAFALLDVPYVTNIKGIAANGSNWLIGGQHDGGGGTENAATYDGSTLTEIDNMGNIPEINTVAGNGLIWLVGGGTDVNNKLFSWNGTNATNLSSNLPTTTDVNSIANNGSIWLIGGSSGVSARLFSYSVDNFINLTLPLTEAADISNVRAIATNGSVWMIGGDNGAGSARLISYDGSTFTDLSANVADMLQIGSIATNGLTWLIGDDSGDTNTTLIRLDMTAPSPAATPQLPFTGR